jgi:hypothetical protein
MKSFYDLFHELSKFYSPDTAMATVRLTAQLKMGFFSFPVTITTTETEIYFETVVLSAHHQMSFTESPAATFRASELLYLTGALIFDPIHL